MEIERVVSDLIFSNMYVIREGGRAIVIDPCRNTAPAPGDNVDRILLTHEHYDHISGVNAWKTATGAPVLCTAACAKGLGSARRNLARIFPEFCQLQTWVRLDEIPETDRRYTCAADETFEDETSFCWQGHAFRLFALPGHSPGGCGILLDETVFFSGDSLLENSETELRLPGGSKEDWIRISMPFLRSLSAGITVYPGHFDPFPYNAALPALR